MALPTRCPGCWAEFTTRRAMLLHAERDDDCTEALLKERFLDRIERVTIRAKRVHPTWGEREEV